MYNYTIQLPNLGVGAYSPRSARPHLLDKIDQIDVSFSHVDLTPANFEDNLLINAVWLSARINSGEVNITNIDLASYAKSCRLHNLNPTIYDAVKVLNDKCSGWLFSLKRAGTWEDILLALLEGLSVMVGGTVYSSFKKAESSGIVPMPKVGEDLLGGQIVNLVGYDKEKDIILAIGNRGERIGRRGFLQYRGSHIRNLSIFRDFFVLVPRRLDAINT